VTVAIVGGGRGYGLDLVSGADDDVVGESIDGIDVAAWNAAGGRWTHLGGVTAGPEQLAELVVSTPDPVMARDLVVRRDATIQVMLRPAAGAGNGPDLPEVAADYLEVAVAYRFYPPGCQPDCQDRECGDDGCGGVCGYCSSLARQCLQGICTCVPACFDRTCGDDVCGGSCGECPAGTTCLFGRCRPS